MAPILRPGSTRTGAPRWDRRASPATPAPRTRRRRPGAALRPSRRTHAAPAARSRTARPQHARERGGGAESHYQPAIGKPMPSRSTCQMTAGRRAPRAIRMPNSRRRVSHRIRQHGEHPAGGEQQRGNRRSRRTGPHRTAGAPRIRTRDRRAAARLATPAPDRRWRRRAAPRGGPTTDPRSCARTPSAAQEVNCAYGV